MYHFQPQPAPGESRPSLRELPALLASRFPSVLLVFAAQRELLGYGETSTSDRYEYTGCWSESYDPGLLGYLLECGTDNHVTGSESGPGYSDSYEKTLNSIGFYHDRPTYTSPSTFDYV